MDSRIKILSCLDSPWRAGPVPVLKRDSFLKLIPDTARRVVLENVFSNISNIRSTLDVAVMAYENDRKNLRLHLMAWHEKITMSIACLVLFLIGAPLGSIIRKGGIGLPLIFAVVFFVIFFLLNNFGEKFVKQDVLEPKIGMWLATIGLLPVGIFLVFKAMRDSQLFNQEFYYRFFRKLRKQAKEKIKRNETGIA